MIAARARRAAAARRRLGGDALGDTLADPVSQDEYDRVADSARVSDVHDLAACLSDREGGVVFAHYGLRCAARAREIAGDLAVSVERVRQIEVAALAKMRSAATA